MTLIVVYFVREPENFHVNLTNVCEEFDCEFFKCGDFKTLLGDWFLLYILML